MRRLVLLALALALPAAARADDLVGEAAAAQAAVEAHVGRVLAHGLEGDAAALERAVDAFARLDDGRREAGHSRTGLTDDLRYLAAALAPSRDARRAALERLLDARPDPVVRRLAEHRLEADDAATADRLLADDRHNRRAAVLNDAVRPLGVFSGAALAAAVNPILLAGSAVDSIVTTAVNLWNYNRLSTPEREALARYAAALDRAPETADAPEIARAIRRLGTKRAEALCDETLAQLDRSLDAGELDRAGYWSRSAARIDGCEARAGEPARRVAKAWRERDARAETARWPVDDPPVPATPGEAADHDALVRATAAADPGAMVEAAGRFRTRHPESRFAGSTAYALAAARELAGHGDGARDALAALAEDDDTSAGRRAAALLASPDFDRLAGLRDAERRHARATARYVLLGSGVDGRTAVYTAAHVGAAGLQAVESLGIFNVIGVATRAWRAWRKDPVSNQEIIDRGESFLASEPRSPEVPDVHRRLADAYERAEGWGRAIMHLRAVPDPDTKRIRRLEEKLADKLVADAGRDGGDPTVLRAVVRHFPDTDAAEEAGRRLADLPAEPGEITLDRDLLRGSPALLGATALDLDPRLLDGRRDNGELAAGGVGLVPPADVRLRLDDDAGERTETRTLAPDAWTRARAAAQEALYARVLTAERRDPETGVLERYIPFYVRGAIGESGVSVAPGVKYRRYRSEDRALYE